MYWKLFIPSNIKWNLFVKNTNIFKGKKMYERDWEVWLQPDSFCQYTLINQKQLQQNLTIGEPKDQNYGISFFL